jgi:hypothetical protein
MLPGEIVNSPMSGTCETWLSLIREAKKIKHELFGQYADESAKFYDSVHNFMWESEYSSGKGGFLAEDTFGSTGFPYFRICVNRVFEAVALFGPALYHRNPNIMVQPKSPPTMTPADLGMDEQDPAQAEMVQAVMGQQQMKKAQEEAIGKLCQHYLNWLQLENDKKVQARRAVNDAIIKGLGLLWTELVKPSGSSISYPRSVYMSCDDLVKDPDARYQEDVQWIARKCVHPVNLVEEKYGMKPGSLRGSIQSVKNSTGRRAKNDKASGKKDSKSFDLIEYWEIYSKNGAGQFLKDYPKKDKNVTFDLSVLGKYCYLAVCDDLPFPLNIPHELLEAHEEAPSEETAEALKSSAQWPIPFWEDEGCNNGWPVSELGFYESPDHIWPIPLIKPAIGEIRFVNWVMSFLADKAAASCTTYLGIAKQAADDLREQVQGKRGPFTTLEITQLTGKPLAEIISFLEAPQFDEKVWTMVAEVMELIDKRTGLTELVYGLSGRQMRSAEEARIKNESTTIRPDEMASKTEDFLSNVAMKEMEAAIWALKPQDWLPVLGEAGTSVFVKNVFGEGEKVNEDFYEHVVRNFTFRVEAGSARKPNKDGKVEQLTALANYYLPTAQAFALGGRIEPFNAFMADMCDALDLDPEKYQLPAPPQDGDGDAQAKLEMEQQKLQMQAQATQLKTTMDMEKTQAELGFKAEEHNLDIQAQQMKMQLDLIRMKQDMDARAAEAQQKMQLQQQTHQQDAEIKDAMAETQIKQANVKMTTDAAMAVEKTKGVEMVSKAKAKATSKPKPKPKKK